MAAYRKIVSSAIRAKTLEWDPNRRMPVEVITALGMANRLGVALWRLRYAGDAHAAPVALALLAKKAEKALPGVGPGMRLKLARCALAEFLEGGCKQCGGTGQHVQQNGVATACASCSATGIGRASDHQRARALGVDAKRVSAWNSKLQVLHDLISGCDTSVDLSLRRRLRSDV